MSFWRNLFGVSKSDTPETSAAANPMLVQPKASATLPASMHQPTPAPGSSVGMEIHDAAWAGDLEKVKTLLKNNSNLVFSQNENGFTPLHCAAFNGHKNVAELLLANKAGVNTNENHGATPLYLAAQKGHKDLAALLLGNEADVNAVEKEFNWTPLHKATFNGHKDVVELLLAHGAE